MAPRAKPAADRRADLMEAATAVFAEKGVGAATVSDVTTAAGVAKGTFYLYFESKEQLVAALRDRFFDELLDEVEGELARLPEGDWWGRVDTLVDLGIRRQLDLLDQHEVLFHQGDGPSGDAARAHADGVERAHARAVGALGRLIADGTAAGAFAVPDPPTTARLLFSALDGGICGIQGHDGRPTDGTPGRAADGGRDLASEVDRVAAATRLLFRRALSATGDPGAPPGSRNGPLRTD
jgi:AcrR family transcriptional regulator